jgi:hypothetical protein
MLNVITPNFFNAQSNYAECYDSECRGAPFTLCVLPVANVEQKSPEQPRWETRLRSLTSQEDLMTS